MASAAYLKVYDHLFQLDFADVCLDETLKVDLLIGSGISWIGTSATAVCRRTVLLESAYSNKVVGGWTVEPLGLIGGELYRQEHWIQLSSRGVGHIQCCAITSRRACRCLTSF